MSVGISVGGGFSRRGCRSDRTRLGGKIFDFFPATWIEKRVYATSNTSENVFFAYDRTPPPFGESHLPSIILDPRLINV